MLRFSRLFGLGKPSSLPNIWRNVRKKRKKRKHKESGGGQQHGQDSDTSEDEKPRRRGWDFDFAPLPAKDQWASDDEEKLLKPIEANETANKQENVVKDECGPKVADWRFGPAQIWYDMLEVPETGDGFNYGFKLKEKVRMSVFLCKNRFLLLVFRKRRLRRSQEKRTIFLMMRF